MDLIPLLDSEFWYEGRLKTFKNWPFQSAEIACNPERMAAAGFIATGGEEEPDSAACFICGKQLDGWEETDDPWQEHTRHQPKCPFILVNKPDPKSWTIEEVFKLLKHRITLDITRKKELAEKKLSNEIRKLANEIPKKVTNVRVSKKSLK